GGSDGEEERGRDALGVYQRLRLNFERLGHAEFFAKGCEGGWRVAPPVIATSGQPGRWMGILCGARSCRLLARMQAAATGRAALHIEQQDGAPLIHQFAATDNAALVAIAAEAGLYLQPDAPLAILSSLPFVVDHTLRQKEELPLGPGWQ